jgi:hypothetical protein
MMYLPEPSYAHVDEARTTETLAAMHFKIYIQLTKQ